jgi:hypothetical protein
MTVAEMGCSVLIRVPLLSTGLVMSFLRLSKRQAMPRTFRVQAGTVRVRPGYAARQLTSVFVLHQPRTIAQVCAYIAEKQL